MKNLKLIVVAVLIGSFGVSNAQSMKEKLQAKLDAKMAKNKKKNRKFVMYDFSDESGISGTYFTNEAIVGNHNTIGFQFSKEVNGEVENKLRVEMGKYAGNANYMEFKLKEKYKTKFDINYFYNTKIDVDGISVNDDFQFVQVGDGIYAFVQESKVLAVAAKDSSKFADYDLETVQVLYEQNMAKINKEKMEKETAKWMKSPIYSKNVGKIIFSDNRGYLMKRGYTNKPPMVDGKGFKTVLDMSRDMTFMAFFQFPPSEEFPGQEINIEYEMGGKKTSRTESRAKSAAWGKMISRIKTSDMAYRQHSPRSLREKNTQDYAFVELLHMQKDKFKVDGEYELTVKMYSSRDGENGKLLAEGVVKLKYTKASVKVYEGDLENNKIGIWAHFDEFLDE